MTTSSASRSQKWLRKNIGVIGIILVALVFAALLAILVTQDVSQDSQESAGVQSPAPSIDLAHEGEHDHEETEYTNEAACESQLSSKELTDFKEAVLQYEAAFQSPDSDSRSERLDALTTAQYKEENSSNRIDEGSQTIVTLLREETIVTCIAQPDGSRRASALVTIQTSFINSEGEKEIIFPKLQLPEIHYSTWVMEDGKWKVTLQE